MKPYPLSLSCNRVSGRLAANAVVKERISGLAVQAERAAKRMNEAADSILEV
jgi:hypothetical protein